MQFTQKWSQKTSLIRGPGGCEGDSHAESLWKSLPSVRIVTAKALSSVCVCYVCRAEEEATVAVSTAQRVGAKVQIIRALWAFLRILVFIPREMESH